MKLDVLFEDNHLLAVSKPVGLPTMGVADDRPTLLSVAKDYVRHKYNKPGNVYLGVVSRLDAPVSGVVLLARTSKAAARLNQQFRERLVQKLYWAVVTGEVDPVAGELEHFLRKDERHRRMHTTSQNASSAVRAHLNYQVRRTKSDLCWLEVRPTTGRKHQIRVQLAKCGHPIVGDRKYGSRHPFAAGIALHARRLVVRHPVTKADVVIAARPPDSWKRLSVVDLYE